MKLKRLAHEFTICKVPSAKELNLNNDFYFIGKTDDEISLVCITKDTPVNTTERDDGWNAFRVEGKLDFSLIGILSDISGILASHQISIFAISTFHTDYVLIKKENFEKALHFLTEAGYSVV